MRGKDCIETPRLTIYFWHNYNNRVRNGYTGMEISRNTLLITALTFAALIGTVALLTTVYATQGTLSPAWNRTFDNGYYDYGSSVIQTADGGFAIAGGSSPTYKGDRNALLIKTDGNGSLQWQRLYGGDKFDYGYAVVETAGGGYALVGVTYSRGNGSGDVYLVRADSGGNVLWERTFGGHGYDEGRALLQTQDGGFLIAGVAGTRDNGSDIYLARTDAVGNVIWERTYGGTYDDLTLSVWHTRDGGYIVGGRYGTGNANGTGYLLKIDAWGRPEWDRQLPGEDGVVYQARQTWDRGYIAVGYTNFSQGRSEILLTHTDHTGTLLWQKTYRSEGTLKGYNVLTPLDGGFLIVGEAGPSSWYEGLLIKTDASGSEEWRQPCSAARDVFLRAGTLTKDGGIALAGSIGDAEAVETWDVYLLKMSRP